MFWFCKSLLAPIWQPKYTFVPFSFISLCHATLGWMNINRTFFFGATHSPLFIRATFCFCLCAVPLSVCATLHDWRVPLLFLVFVPCHCGVNDHELCQCCFVPFFEFNKRCFWYPCNDESATTGVHSLRSSMVVKASTLGLGVITLSLHPPNLGSGTIRVAFLVQSDHCGKSGTRVAWLLGTRGAGVATVPGHAIYVPERAGVSPQIPDFMPFLEWYGVPSALGCGVS